MQTSPDLWHGTTIVTVRKGSDVVIGGDGQVLNASHFAPPIDQVIWDGFPADADADGDVDLIGNRVVRNMLRHGAAAGLRRQYGDGTPLLIDKGRRYISDANAAEDEDEKTGERKVIFGLGELIA